jgi:hypothetical protein
VSENKVETSTEQNVTGASIMLQEVTKTYPGQKNLRLAA